MKSGLAILAVGATAVFVVSNSIAAGLQVFCPAGRYEGVRSEYEDGRFRTTEDGIYYYQQTRYVVRDGSANASVRIGETTVPAFVLFRTGDAITIAYRYKSQVYMDTVFPARGVVFNSYHKNGGYLGNLLPVATTFHMRCTVSTPG